MLRKLVEKNRSYRRFDATHTLSQSTMIDFIEFAQLCPSAANIQPLKYYLSYTPETNDLIFPHLFWAGYLADWDGPSVHERPTGYIIILQDKKIVDKLMWPDQGIVAQTILLRAVEKNLGGCIIGSINKTELKTSLGLSDQYEILLVLALGKPMEKVKIETAENSDNIQYYRDEQGMHIVPKRKIQDLIVHD